MNYRHLAALAGVACMGFAFDALAGDEVLVRTKHYLINIHTDEDTGIAQLFRIGLFGRKILIAGDEDIGAMIEKRLPRREAYALTLQLVDLDIKRSGGAKKCQEKFNEAIKAREDDFFHFVTPMRVEAYRARGVLVPQTKASMRRVAG
jgi:hypothetical protein